MKMHKCKTKCIHFFPVFPRKSNEVFPHFCFDAKKTYGHKYYVAASIGFEEKSYTLEEK